MKTITIVVSMEGHFGTDSLQEEIEVDVDGLSEEQVEEACKDAASTAFFNYYNYGWSVKE